MSCDSKNAYGAEEEEKWEIWKNTHRVLRHARFQPYTRDPLGSDWAVRINSDLVDPGDAATYGALVSTNVLLYGRFQPSGGGSSQQDDLVDSIKAALLQV